MTFKMSQTARWKIERDLVVPVTMSPTLGKLSRPYAAKQQRLEQGLLIAISYPRDAYHILPSQFT